MVIQGKAAKTIRFSHVSVCPIQFFRLILSLLSESVALHPAQHRLLLLVRQTGRRDLHQNHLSRVFWSMAHFSIYITNIFTTLSLHQNERKTHLQEPRMQHRLNGH